MPLDPAKDPNAFHPDAPKARSAATVAPPNPDDLLEFGADLVRDHDPLRVDLANLPPVQLFHAARVSASSDQAMSVPQHVTVYVTFQDLAPRLSNEDALLVPHLQRTVHGDVPPDLQAMPHTGLREVAGSPLPSLSGTGNLQAEPANELSLPGDLLPPTLSSSLHTLRHVTPEFDSTRQVMRTPAPHAVQTDHSPPLPMPPLSHGLNDSVLAQQAPPSAPAADAAVPQSAPPALHTMPSTHAPMTASHDSYEPMFRQALAREREDIAFLRMLELVDSSLALGAGQETDLMPPLVRLPALRPMFEPGAPGNATDPVNCDANSDCDAVQLAGGSHYLSM